MSSHSGNGWAPLDICGCYLVPLHLEQAFEKVPANVIRIVRMPPRQLATFFAYHRVNLKDYIEHAMRSYAFQIALELENNVVDCWIFDAGNAQFHRRIKNIGIPGINV